MEVSDLLQQLIRAAQAAEVEAASGGGAPAPAASSSEQEEKKRQPHRPSGRSHGLEVQNEIAEPMPIEVEAHSKDPWGVKLGPKDSKSTRFVIQRVFRGKQFDRLGAMVGQKITHFNGMPVDENPSQILKQFYQREKCLLLLEDGHDEDDEYEEEEEEVGDADQRRALMALKELMGLGNREGGFKEDPDEDVICEFGLEHVAETFIDMIKKSMMFKLKNAGTDDDGDHIILLEDTLTDTNFAGHFEKDWITFRSCFRAPKKVPAQVFSDACNKWNAGKKFTRMFLDNDGDIMLQADYPIEMEKQGMSKRMLRNVLKAFHAALISNRKLVREAVEEHIMK